MLAEIEQIFGGFLFARPRRVGWWSGWAQARARGDGRREWSNI